MSNKLKIFVMFIGCVGLVDTSFGQTIKKFINRAVDQNLCLQTTPGGSPGDGLCVDGASDKHVNIPIALRIGSTAAAVKKLDVVVGSSSDGIRVQSASGEFHGMLARGNTFDIVSNSADAGAAGDIRFNIGGETSTKGMVARAGGWIFGSSTPGQFLNLDHVVNGRLNINIPGANGRMDWTIDSTTGTIEFARFRDASGTNTAGNISINATAHTTAFNTSSDRRLKTKFADFNGSGMVMKMHPTEYERKSEPGVKEFGFVAQELIDVLPQAVTKGVDEEAIWSVDYGKLTGVLTKALQEVIKKNEALEARIKVLESR